MAQQCQALVRELLPLLELVTGAAARPLAAPPRAALSRASGV